MSGRNRQHSGWFEVSHLKKVDLPPEGRLHSCIQPERALLLDDLLDDIHRAGIFAVLILEPSFHRRRMNTSDSQSRKSQEL